MAGWVKWFRSAELNKVLNDGEPFDKTHAFLWLVESAATEATIRKGVRLKKGQLLTTYRFMKDTWHWGSHQKIKKFLEELEGNKMIRLNSHKNGTLVTICNYNVYQSFSEKNGTRSNTQTATQTATINKKKEERAKNLDDFSHSPSKKDPRYGTMKEGEADVL